jgi:hypothetical protein
VSVPRYYQLAILEAVTGLEFEQALDVLRTPTRSRARARGRRGYTCNLKYGRGPSDRQTRVIGVRCKMESDGPD